MLYHIGLILGLQLIGEITSRSLGLPVPGPVIGMVLFVILMMLRSDLFTQVEPTASGILRHLSLLFVPAGVGLVGHIDRLDNALVPVLVAIVGSTVLTILVTVYTFSIVAKLTGASDNG